MYGQESSGKRVINIDNVSWVRHVSMEPIILNAWLHGFKSLEDSWSPSWVWAKRKKLELFAGYHDKSPVPNILVGWALLGPRNDGSLWHHMMSWVNLCSLWGVLTQLESPYFWEHLLAGLFQQTSTTRTGLGWFCHFGISTFWVQIDCKVCLFTGERMVRHPKFVFQQRWSHRFPSIKA